MSVDVLNEITINRSLADVVAYAANPNHAPDWYVNIKSVEWVTPPPLGIGTRIAFVAQFLGRRLAYTYQVVDWIPEERLVMRTSEGPFPMETTYEWHAVEQATTRMTLRNRGTPEGFARIVGFFMRAAVDRANRKDLARLKEILEKEE